MKIRFIKDGTPHGYSFLAGEVCNFPEEIAELIIKSGIAVRCTSERSVNHSIHESLKEAQERDGRNHFNG